MLVSDGVKLIFFTVAGAGLCFGQHRADIAEIFLLLLSRTYTEPRLFLLLTPLPMELGGDTPTNQRDIL